MAAEPQFRGPEPGAHPPPPDHPEHGPAEAVYPYRDEAGSPLFYVCRYEVPAKREGEEPGKTFLQGHYTGAGKWAWNLRGIEPVLYRLPEVLEHLRRNEEHAPLYIVEGEKAVEYLRRYLTQHALPGEVTCNPMGAGKWRDSYTDTLEGGRYLVVVADNDQPGFNGARKVQQEVSPHVGRLELMRPAVPDEHAGVDDHLAAGHTLEELVPFEPEAGEEAAAAPQPFIGLTHEEVLGLEFEEEPHLVDGLIERGTVGTYAGVPESYKSWAAQATAVRVARGEGEVLGREVKAGGPVGYFWQDDSKRNEAERVKAYAAAQELPAQLPGLRWYLNEGLELPRDLERLRATVEHFGFVLVVLDSFYNFAGGIELKSEDAALIVAALKREVCDPTGCAVLLVDHAPWPSEFNRGQQRAYGSVLKGAAVRWGVYFERDRSKAHVSARGNNVRGFPRSVVVWDAEALELRLVEVSQGPDEEALAEAREWLGRHLEAEYAKDGGGRARGKVEAAYVEEHPERGSRALIRRVIDAQLELLASLEQAEEGPEAGEPNGEQNLVLAVGPGEHHSGVYLYPVGHAPSPLAATPNGEHGEQAGGATEREVLAVLAKPSIDGEHNGEHTRGGEQEPSQEELEGRPLEQQPHEDDIPW